MFWQYNDCWPVCELVKPRIISGRWKALHYLARRFYAPLLVSGLEIPRAGEIDVYTTSDLGESRHGTVEWTVTDLAGKELLRDSLPVKCHRAAARK